MALSLAECQRAVYRVPASLRKWGIRTGLDAACYKVSMRREFSAGGVLVRRLKGGWAVAAIRPAGRSKPVWALPKGLIDEGETAETTALREVAEETGAEGTSLGKLGDVRYVYTWDGERIFKVVSFFLL